MELYTTIKDFEDYLIYNDGRIYSIKKDKFLNIGNHLDGRGYREVRLWKDGKRYYKHLHRLLAEAFLENPHNLRTVNHKDGNKLNNSLDNLEWMNDEDQQRHAFKLGLKTHGISMSDEDIYEIYDMYFINGLKPKTISEKLGKPFGTIKKICYGERCKNLLSKYREKHNF